MTEIRSRIAIPLSCAFKDDVNLKIHTVRDLPTSNDYDIYPIVNNNIWIRDIGTYNYSGKKNIFIGAYKRLLQIPHSTHVTNLEVRSRIEEGIGETDNLLKIVRRRKLWTCQQTNKYIGQRYPAGKCGGVNGSPRKNWQ